MSANPKPITPFATTTRGAAMSNLATIPVSTDIAPVVIDERRLARLRERARLSAAIETWKPQPGDTIEGAIVGARQEEGPFGPQHQALIQTPTGPVFAVWLTRWLENQFRLQEADIGSMASITFIGQERSQTGKTFNKMAVTIIND